MKLFDWALAIVATLNWIRYILTLLVNHEIVRQMASDEMRRRFMWAAIPTAILLYRIGT